MAGAELPVQATHACDHTPVDHERLSALADEIFALVDEVVAVRDGYDLVIRQRSESLLLRIGQFVAYDSICCGFMTHSMKVEAHGGPVHVGFTADPSAQPMIAHEVGRLVRPEVAEAAGLTPTRSA